MQIENLVPYLVWLAVGLVMALGVLMSRQVDHLLRAKLNNEQYRTITNVVANAVLAAEQYLASADGQAKKEYAIRWASEFLTDKGLTVTPELLDVLIESAVFENLHYLESGPVLSVSAG